MAYFLQEAAQRYQRPPVGWTPADLVRWGTYDWPGNVRELKNVAERCALGLPDALFPVETPASSFSLSARVERAKKEIIEEALSQCKGNVADTAESLQTPRKTLYDKLTRHGIVVERFR